jgi:uncharacterized protein YndB with AHSA1/START domain
MDTKTNEKITIKTSIKAPIDKVWKYWTAPEHITKWNNASDDWHSPRAVNDVRAGGKFNIRMEARDGSQGFDFGGVYEDVKQNKFISYTMGDGRSVTVDFDSSGNETTVKETFEAESQNSPEMQKNGWQAILDNFKKYVEKN